MGRVNWRELFFGKRKPNDHRVDLILRSFCKVNDLAFRYVEEHDVYVLSNKLFGLPFHIREFRYWLNSLPEVKVAQVLSHHVEPLLAQDEEGQRDSLQFVLQRHWPGMSGTPLPGSNVLQFHLVDSAGAAVMETAKKRTQRWDEFVQAAEENAHRALMQASIRAVAEPFPHVDLQTWNAPASALLMAPRLKEKIESHVGWPAEVVVAYDALYAMNIGTRERLVHGDAGALRFLLSLRGICVVGVSRAGLRHVIDFGEYYELLRRSSQRQ
jgi:hypothetical protein